MGEMRERKEPPGELGVRAGMGRAVILVSLGWPRWGGRSGPSLGVVSPPCLTHCGV